MGLTKVNSGFDLGPAYFRPGVSNNKLHGGPLSTAIHLDLLSTPAPSTPWSVPIDVGQ